MLLQLPAIFDKVDYFFLLQTLFTIWFPDIHPLKLCFSLTMASLMFPEHVHHILHLLFFGPGTYTLL